MNFKIKRALGFGVISIVIIVLVLANILCVINSRQITLSLYGTGISFEEEEVKKALALGDELCQQIAEEGIVMLKNDNNALPLSDNSKRVNVFGWASTSAGFILSGEGSGRATLNPTKSYSLLEAFEKNGYMYNKELEKFYTSYKSSREGAYTLIEPIVADYPSEIIASAKSFSSTAIVVLSRFGGENLGEIPTFQEKYNMPRDDKRTYLEVSTEEEALIEMLAENFNKVIVIVNSCNAMHLGILNNPMVDAALFVGVLGQSGTLAIPKVLFGSVNPSGRLADTYTYSYKYDPSFANRERKSNNIQYIEDIYFGYKWYETADEEGFFSEVDNQYGKGYDGVVQYPFGYGLSYTSFKWEITNVTLPSDSNLSKKESIEITLSVTNTGMKAGKDVIQVYCTPPYYSGGIEKAHRNLVGFAKTALLKPNQTQQNIKIVFDIYDMAAFDCYDKNSNGALAYEVEKGQYEINLLQNAHADPILEPIIFNVENTLIYKRDPKTNKIVKTRFVGDYAYSGVSIDGKNVGATTPYLTRQDFKGTFPATQAVLPTNTTMVLEGNNYINKSYDTDKMPIYSQDSGLRLVTRESGDFASQTDLKGNGANLKFNDNLMQQLGSNYNDSNWQTLIRQMSIDEMARLVELGGFRTQEIESIGKPYCSDYDGPAGFNVNIISPSSPGEWTAYPSQTMIACTYNTELGFIMGLTIGVEASSTNVNGWYAPGLNLHRSAYNSRNYEYYSEDAVLTGKMGAEVIRGAKTNGLYCYMKHFVLGEPGQNSIYLNTWVTESNLRENYLKPFEIAVKEGGANAVMTAFNRVGAVWAGGNYALNVAVLRDEWGFRGSLVTDYTTGDDYMNIEQGLRGGNDLWLNPRDISSKPLNKNNPTTVYCIAQASKNILFTYCSTYEYAKNNVSNLDEKYSVEVGIKKYKKQFSWWSLYLIFIDITTCAAVSFCSYRLIRKPKKAVETHS